MGKTFKYNDSNCCLNPDVEIIHDCSHFLAKISVSCKEGRWTYGYSYRYKGSSTGCSGGGSGCCFNEYRQDQMYSSKQEAREAAIKYLIGRFKERGNHPTGASNKWVLAALQEALTPQGELF